MEHSHPTASRPDICFKNKKKDTCLLLISPVLQVQQLVGGSKLHAAVSGTSCSNGVETIGHSAAGIAQWLDIIPGHHNQQHLQKQGYLDPLKPCGKSCLLFRQPWSMHL